MVNLNLQNQIPFQEHLASGLSEGPQLDRERDCLLGQKRPNLAVTRNDRDGQQNSFNLSRRAPF